MFKPELLSPAGNFEKLRAAFFYGADAVYLAGEDFGMRAAADNFTIDEIYEAVEYAHERNRRVYLTVNILPRWDEFDKLENYLFELSGSNIDAVIVASPGVLRLCKKHLPNAEIHVSTQAGVVNHEDCMFWYEQGAKRVVLARELSLSDIREIKARIPSDLEIEAFVHGSMCVSFSGRCLLSEHLVGRDANRGKCAQPCRWNYGLYEIVEEKRPNMPFPIDQNSRGTFIMSSKDMCLIEHIPELIEAGINSFKIEGRIKSAYYTAVTTNTYRMAIDKYLADPKGYSYDPAWLEELESVSHREYCTGYFFDNPIDNPMLCKNPGYIREKAYLAVAIAYDEKEGRATFIQRNKVNSGDKVELISPGKTGRSFVASNMRDENGNSIESAPHPYMTFSVEVPFEIKVGDIMRGTR